MTKSPMSCKRVLNRINEIVLFTVALAIGALAIAKQNREGESRMKIESLAFKHNEKIPSKYTCDAGDVSPPLQFSDVPKNAKSLVLIMDDPDAPMGTWDHWTVWNIDPTTRDIPEGSTPAGAVEGTQSWKQTGYGGPCPPSGTHRYFFKLFALDTRLNLPSSVNKAKLEAAMKGHVLDKAELIGLYSRKK